MLTKAKAWFLAASVLVFVGGGCAAPAKPVDQTPPLAPPAAVEADEVDQAVDAYLQEVAAEDAALKEEEADAASLKATDAEVNAFGQIYDQNEF
jgi:hypothetical protein